MEKRNTKLSASSATDIMGGPEPCNISSNGRDIPKVTTLGNQPCIFMPRISLRPIITSAHWNE
jgi:hypothetical protein